MTDYEAPYNEVAKVDDEYYLVQDGELFEEPMVRSINQLLEPEKDEVQKMLEEAENYD